MAWKHALPYCCEPQRHACLEGQSESARHWSTEHWACRHVEYGVYEPSPTQSAFVAQAPPVPASNEMQPEVVAGQVPAWARCCAGAGRGPPS